MNDIKINKGYIEGFVYIKHVDFSKAVLWKDKQLSIPPDIFNELLNKNIGTMIFIGKKEIWEFKIEDVNKNKILKIEGQEEQYYFPISLAKRIKKEQYI